MNMWENLPLDSPKEQRERMGGVLWSCDFLLGTDANVTASLAHTRR